MKIAELKDRVVLGAARAYARRTMADYAEHCSGVVSVRDGAEMLARCDELGAALR